MFPPLALLVVALQGAVPAVATPAQARQPVRSTAIVAPTAKGPAVDGRLARADSLVFAGNIRAARPLYRALIRSETDAGHYAQEALWHLAMAYHLADDPAGTVRTLDQLAFAAAQFGDPETELMASYEAARFYAAMRQPFVARDRLARVRCLMQSPVIPAAMKADYTARLATKE